MGKIYFLDENMYPNARVASSILDSQQPEVSDFVLSSVEDFITEGDRELDLFHSLIPEVNSHLSELGFKSYSDLASLDFIKALKKYLIAMSPHIMVPKLKLSHDDVDPMKLAKIYLESPTNSVKIQTNGMPFISEYKGLTSFLDINELDSGIVSPATIEESQSLDDASNYLKQDYILQILPSNKLLLKITERVSNDLTWYDTEYLDLPEDLVQCVDECNAELIKIEGRKEVPHYFLYLKSLKTFKVSSVHPGINYHVDPNNYF